MFTKLPLRRGFTITEVMVALALSALLGSIVIFLTLYTGRSFVAMDNYTDMDLGNQLALDKISKLIRQGKQVSGCTSNGLSLLDAAGNPIQLNYDPTAKSLTVAYSGSTNVYLTNCTSLQFWIYQHTPISNSFDCYSPAYVTNARVVQFTWTSARTLLGGQNTETTESAEVALRNH